jgi:hypothetical protein
MIFHGLPGRVGRGKKSRLAIVCQPDAFLFGERYGCRLSLPAADPRKVLSGLAFSWNPRLTLSQPFSDHSALSCPQNGDLIIQTVKPVSPRVCKPDHSGILVTPKTLSNINFRDGRPRTALVPNEVMTARNDAHGSARKVHSVRGDTHINSQEAACFEIVWHGLEATIPCFADGIAAGIVDPGIIPR